jgi:hypothetical protein
MHNILRKWLPRGYQDAGESSQELSHEGWNACGRQPKRIAETDRVPARKPVEVQPARQPDRIFLREDAVCRPWKSAARTELRVVAAPVVATDPYAEAEARSLKRRRTCL